MLEEMGRRLKASRDALGWSLRDLSYKIGGILGASAIRNIENGTSEVGWATLFAMAKALQVDPVWLATGEGHVSDAGELTRRWERIPPPARRLMADLEDWLGGEERPTVRRELRTVRLVGDVAAWSEGSPSFDERQGDEVDIPADLWSAGCVAMRARGESMTGAGILDGDLLVVTRVELGGYQRG